VVGVNPVFPNAELQKCLSLNRQVLFVGWALGYWSGLNAGTKINVGQSTDAQGMIGEIDLVCSANPSTRFTEAVARARNKLAAKRR
jgi:hypothetical protein